MARKKKTVFDDKPERLNTGDVVDKTTGPVNPFPKEIQEGTKFSDVEPADSDDLGVKSDEQVKDSDDTGKEQVSDDQSKSVEDEIYDIFKTVSIDESTSDDDKKSDSKEAEMLEMLRQRDEYIKQLADMVEKLRNSEPQKDKLPDSDVDEAIFEDIIDPVVKERVKRYYKKQQEAIKRLEEEIAQLKNVALQTSLQQQVEQAKSYSYSVASKLVREADILPELQEDIKRVIDGALYAYAMGVQEARQLFSSKKDLINWIKGIVQEKKRVQDQLKKRLAGGMKTREETPAIGGGGLSKGKEEVMPKTFDEAKRYLAKQLREFGGR